MAAYVQSSEFDAVFEATGVREAYVNKVGTSPTTVGGDSRARCCASRSGATATRVLTRAALDVDSENPTGALGLYQSVGFEVQQRWSNYLLRA